MIELNICIGSSCHLKGAYNIVENIQQKIKENNLEKKINFKASFCMQQCSNQGVCITVNGQKHNMIPNDTGAFFDDVIIPMTK